MQTDQDNDDDEPEDGEWLEYTADGVLAEERIALKAKEDVWPHWSEGVPTKLRRMLGSPAFLYQQNHHRFRTFYVTIEYQWSPAYGLLWLDKHKSYLPENYKKEWSGVYRIFSPNTTIDRCCGKDPTGTLYVGMAGARRGGGSLRSRLNAILNRGHHAMDAWLHSDVIREKFPASSLNIEWAYMGDRTNYNGQAAPAAPLAETFLLKSYNESYGEFPPWNQKG